MPEYKRTIRRSQTISPYGPGAIVDYGGESFISCNAEQWQNQGTRINEARLQSLLNREHFRLAPEPPDDNRPHPNLGFPVYRFPDWLFCRQCRNMSRWSTRRRPQETRMDKPVCSRCQVPLSPMRFVSVCAHGHIDDVPWEQWCHQGGACSLRTPQMRFITGERRGGLEDLFIICECGSRRSLGGITDPAAMKAIDAGCTGRQPWEPPNDSCNLYPRVVQRGATNVHFAATVSSIDIPPYSSGAGTDLKLLNAVLASSQYQMYQPDEDEAFKKGLARQLARLLSAEFDGLTPEQVESIMVSGPQDEVAGTARRVYTSEEDLKNEEYDAFLAPYTSTDLGDLFQKNDVKLSEAIKEAVKDEPAYDQWNNLVRAVDELFDRLVLITRLREVRVLKSFTRLDDSGGSVREIARRGINTLMPEPVRDVKVALDQTPWLPSVEVFGEGIFFTLNSSVVDAWFGETIGVRERAKLIRDRQANVAGGPMQTDASAQFVLLHTLTHLLIRQLSFTCGYGSSALRERLYCTIDPSGKTVQAGALIYTSAGDSEGTLGGLVRQGHPEDFISTLVDALRNALWCSSDPLCQESRGQGRDALNLAACHACSLLPETSCSEMNRFLDRALVVGQASNPDTGYFANVLKLATIV